MLTTLAPKMCMEIKWKKTATKDGFVRYEFTSGEVLGDREESVQGGKSARVSGGSSMTVNLAAVSVFFQADREQVDINDISRDYEEYCGLAANHVHFSGADFDTLLDQDLLWDQAADSIEVLEEHSSTFRALIDDTGSAVPVSKTEYVDLVQRLAGEVKDARQKSEADERKLAERDTKNEELNLKVQLLADDSEKIARFQAKVTTRNVELCGAG